MSEVLIENPAKEGVTPQTFDEIVLIQLRSRRVTSICRECAGAQTWEDWEILPMPIVSPLVGAQATVMMVCVTCRKCGYVRLFTLAWLGIQLEQRRIITPGASH
jgi:hypothetical protein